MRKTPLVTGEFYHIYNRGVDKRSIFSSQEDLARFYQSMQEFNSVNPIGSLYANSFLENSLSGRTAKLVEFVAYSLNHNHYHFLLKQVGDNGISEFMKRLNGGYCSHFNTKHKRTGALFQGRFKSIHIDSNEYLLHLSVYINLNDRHEDSLKGRFVKSSWKEYAGKEKDSICKTDIILDQFKGFEEYKKFADSSLEDIVNRKALLKDFT